MQFVVHRRESRETFVCASMCAHLYVYICARARIMDISACTRSRTDTHARPRTQRCRRQSTFNGAHFIFMPDYLWNANRLLAEPLQKTEQLATETILAYLHGYSFRNSSAPEPPLRPPHQPSIGRRPFDTQIESCSTLSIVSHCRFFLSRSQTRSAVAKIFN